MLLGFLWIAPMVTLLLLNFNQHIIGASAWCPKGDCSHDPVGNSADSFTHIKELDEADHNTLGALQFVAKGLEIWFAAVATNLIYNIAMRLASGDGGLPISYLLAHLEVLDFLCLLELKLWKAPLHLNGYPRRKRRTIALYIFAVFTALMCILANLMGPAVASLVLPTLQWKNTTIYGEQKLIVLDIGTPPAGDTLFPNCSSTLLSRGLYSCTSDTYAASLDNWASFAIASEKQNSADLHASFNYDRSAVQATSQERAVSFTFNTTLSSVDGAAPIFWAPSRQTLRDLSLDLANFIKTTQGNSADPSYGAYNNSLQTILNRQGPAIGVQANLYQGNASVTTVVDQLGSRQIRCFDKWTAWSDDEYTKCVRTGEAWNVNATNKFAQFNISSATSADEAVVVNIYFSDRATFISGTTYPGSAPPACFRNGSAPTDGSCKWDNIFDPANLPAHLSNSSTNVVTMEFAMPRSRAPSYRILVEFLAYMDYSAYSFDTSVISNPLRSTQTNLPRTADQVAGKAPLVVHPDWILAAYSVDRFGMLPFNRSSATALVHATRLLSDAAAGAGPASLSESDATTVVAELTFIAYSVGQALSMVSYQVTRFANPASAGGVQDASVLRRWGMIHVWAYGFSSRTSKVGIVVVMVGLAAVLLRTVLELGTGIRKRTTSGILADAMEHLPRGDFQGLGDDEELCGRVRVRVVEKASGSWGFEAEEKTPGLGLGAGAGAWTPTPGGGWS